VIEVLNFFLEQGDGSHAPFSGGTYGKLLLL